VRGYLNAIMMSSVAFIYSTIALGALTRAMGAGMGCGPDWPLCLGYIVPPAVVHEVEVLLEYAHRLSALAAFLTVLVGALLASRLNPASESKSVRLWAYTTLAIMVAQILVGAAVVKLHLNPALSALHTMLATLTAITATIAAVEARHYTSRVQERSI